MDSPKGSQQTIENPYPTHKRRQKSFGADSPDVVTIGKSSALSFIPCSCPLDHIRPDWEAKLTAVRAAVTRRANRRIIMRQVGDRLIPVGVTSGRVHALSPEEAAQAEQENNGGSRRSRRRQQSTIPGFEQYVGMGGQDLEEVTILVHIFTSMSQYNQQLMVMEAMRLSLLEHEEQQRKEAEEKKKKKPNGGSTATSESGPSAEVASSQRSDSPSGPASSTARLSTSSAQSKPESKRRSFLSRSRSPSPPAVDTSSSWRRRSSNSPALSTLNAALSGATSTASAFLTPPTPSESLPASNSATGSSPTTSESCPIAIHQDFSLLSVDSAPGTSYDQLPSSPESVLATEPLLSANGEHTPTKATTSRDSEV